MMKYGKQQKVRKKYKKRDEKRVPYGKIIGDAAGINPNTIYHMAKILREAGCADGI